MNIGSNILHYTPAPPNISNTTRRHPRPCITAADGRSLRAVSGPAGIGGSFEQFRCTYDTDTGLYGRF